MAPTDASSSTGRFAHEGWGAAWWQRFVSMQRGPALEWSAFTVISPVWTPAASTSATALK
ncbi:MAG TPA: hypothetical protein VNG12_14830 [Acidimicrobiales bacterium]|nr:hypothetical protein [Acidimicrobiales bacterium]